MTKPETKNPRVARNRTPPIEFDWKTIVRIKKTHAGAKSNHPRGFGTLLSTTGPNERMGR